MPLTDLPARRGPRPATTPMTPHHQVDQIAPVSLQDRLRDHALALPGVRRGRSNVSVPDSIAFFLDTPLTAPVLPSQIGGEFGHIHGHHDGSLHVWVPEPDAALLIEQGWAEFHHVVTWGLAPPVVVMIYGPRDEEEYAVAVAAVETAYVAAGGAAFDASGRPLGHLIPAKG
jgi:hypothetical protein